MDKVKKVKIYLAGGMFCEGDRMYNEFLAKKIRERFGDYIELYVPQENKSINDKTKCANSADIFWGDYNRLQNTDILIARIDGDIPPSGTSAEIGIMSQRRQNWEETIRSFIDGGDELYTYEEAIEYLKDDFPKPQILGLCTDSRNPRATYLEAKNENMKNDDIESQYCYFNLFTVGCIKVNGKLATSTESLLNDLEEMLKDYNLPVKKAFALFKISFSGYECSNCGYEIAENEKICPHCHAKITGVE